MHGVKDLRFRINQEFTRIGRHSQNDICLVTGAETTLSRWHAQIRKSKTGTYTISDISVNGTYVNRIRVVGNVELNDGDIINIGCKGGHEIRPGEPMLDGLVPEFNLKLCMAIEGDYLEKTDTDRRPVKIKQEHTNSVLIDKLGNSDENDEVKLLMEWEIKSEFDPDCQIINSKNSNKNTNDINNNNITDLNKTLEQTVDSRKRHTLGDYKTSISTTSTTTVNKSIKNNKPRKRRKSTNHRKNKKFNYIISDENSSCSSSCKENDNIIDSTDDYISTKKNSRLKNLTHATATSTTTTHSGSNVKYVQFVKGRTVKEVVIDKRNYNSSNRSGNSLLSNNHQDYSGVYPEDSQDECASRYCKRPVMSEITWVQCDDCDKWYHLFCIDCALDIEEIKKSKYSCCKY